MADLELVPQKFSFSNLMPKLVDLLRMPVGTVVLYEVENKQQVGNFQTYAKRYGGKVKTNLLYMMDARTPTRVLLGVRVEVTESAKPADKSKATPDEKPAVEPKQEADGTDALDDFNPDGAELDFE